MMTLKAFSVGAALLLLCASVGRVAGQGVRPPSGALKQQHIPVLVANSQIWY
jgi:hypothetical protein